MPVSNDPERARSRWRTGERSGQDGAARRQARQRRHDAGARGRQGQARGRHDLRPGQGAAAGAQLANGGVACRKSMPGAMVTLADGTVVAAAAVPRARHRRWLGDARAAAGRDGDAADGTVVGANARRPTQPLADGAWCRSRRRSDRTPRRRGHSVADEIVNIVEGCDNADVKSVLEPDCMWASFGASATWSARA